ncbi:MAG: DNRLRE domain-containing protein [Actinomycetota bacterium]|nr:DNRLRE domain-containing protein [Actinomycetota bacterium]
MTALLVPAVPIVTGGSAQALEAPVGFTSEALSTWQTNGIAWAAASARGLVFVGGTFTSIRPPGAAAGVDEQARANLAVFDAATGAPTSCAPSFTLPTAPAQATVRTLEVSPDGKTLYVGGYFSTVNGVALQHLAALDIASCTLVSSFKPLPAGTVRALVATPDAVYFAGGFGTVKSVARARAAAVTAVGTAAPGTLLDWAPTFDKEVRALTIKPDGTVVVVGGDFDTVNGAGSHALAVVDATSGANVRTFPGFIPAASVVKALTADASGFYTGNEGTGFQVFDGRLAVDWSTYQQRWRDTCLGATQSVALYKGVLYSGSHAHDCSTMNEFPDGPRNHLLAQSVDNPTLLPWFPNTNGGIGEALGPRELVVAQAASGADYLWVVGEFTTVSGRRQQGITRFGQGVDRVGPSGPTPSVTSTRAGQVRVAWRQSLDTDDSTLTYRVYRDGSSTPIYTKTSSAWFWARRQLVFTDTGLANGSSHTYRITASDGTNTTTTPWRSVTVASASTSPYQERVLSDGASFLWRYDEPSDLFVSDASRGDNNGALRGGATYQVSPGAIAGDPSRALTLNGTTGAIYSETRYDPPATGSAVYTMETWFKTTTTTGGKLIGFGDKQSINSRFHDRHVYMTNSGKLVFGVSPSSPPVTLTSPASYNDGLWHHVAATQGSAGMALYVDGARVARNTVTTSHRYPGYWRIGGDSIASSWPSAPTSTYFAGSLDETAVYPTALSAQTIADHVRLAGATAAPGAGGPADFYGQTVFNDDPTLYWRLGENAGPTAADAAGGGPTGKYGTGVTFGRAGAPSGVQDTAVSTDGTTNGLVATSASMSSPAVFSVEAWFRTSTAGMTTGGKIVGFGSAATGASGNYDRHVYMLSDGRLAFGTYSGSYQIATTTAKYNDGAYHHVVATKGSGGLQLYVDGVRAAVNSSTATPNSYTGYWRVGGDNLTGWSGATGNGYFAGTVDEVAVYPRQLTATQAAAHYSAAGHGTADVAAPTAPSNVTAGVAGGDAVLQWTASSDNVGVTAYDIHRSTTANFAPSASTLVRSQSGTSFTDAGVGTGTWHYRVIARDAAGNASVPSSTASVTISDTVAPTAPGGLSVETGRDSATLSWTSATDNVAVTEYHVFRSTSSGFTPGSSNLVATVTGTGYQDARLAPGTYYYRVAARDAAGNVGPATAEVRAALSDTAAPSSPDAVTTSVAGSAVTVTWAASTDDSGVTGYELHRSATSGFEPASSTLVASVTGTTATDNAVDAGTWYYRVVARDAAGNRSTASAPASAVVAPSPTVVTLTPTADAYGNQGAASTNYGVSSSLASRGNPGAASYLRFSLPAAPAGKELTSAVFQLRTSTDAAAGSVDAHAVRFASDAWDESTLTWNNRPALEAGYLGTLAGGTATSTAYAVPLEVPSLVPALGGARTLAVAPVDASGTDSVYFWSRNHSSTTYRPALVLTFTPVTADSSDKTSPTTPSGLAAEVSGSSVSLTWSASSDDVGVTRYDVHRSTSATFTPAATNRVGTTSAASYGDTGVPAGTWYYRVVALDAAGNASTPSAAAEAVVAAAPTSPTTTPTIATVTPTADTYANAGATTTNYGASSSLASRGSPGAVSYLRFALPPAPAGQRLTGAVLRFRTSTETTAGSAEPHMVALADDTWSEDTLTWANRPAVSATAVGTITGATAASTPYSAELDAQALAGLVGSTRTLAVTNTGTDSLWFWSRNHATAGYRPELVLTYS